MDTIEIKDMFKRNYTQEKEILTNFSKILKSYISYNEISQTLEKNGFQGVYVLDDSDFKEIDINKKGLGFYCHESKIIVLNGSYYYSDKAIGIHEMGHAFLNGRNRSVINVDGIDIIYGNGLEEGAVSLLMSTNRVNDISGFNVAVYRQQARIFQQLSILYGYSNVKEYPNLLIHMLKEPENFISLIRKIYVDIYKSQYKNVRSYLLDKSAYDVLVGTDIITNCENNCKTILEGVNLINRLYLSLADIDIREGIKENPYFTKTTLFDKKAEEILLSRIFGCETGYAERMEDRLDNLLDVFQTEIERVESNNDNNVSMCKIILPR